MIATLSEAMERVSLQAPGEEEKEKEEQGRIITPFRFFDLPSEIRLKIYSLVLFTPRRKNASRTNGSVGSSSKNKPLAPVGQRLSLFLASRRIHDEATHLFYSVQTFRVFPIQDYSRLPTVRALSPRYRAAVSTIELILGSSWTAPPKSWRVNDSLGLQDMVRVRTLKVFVQCDPSHPVFDGFRKSRDFYTWYAGNLLREILQRLPGLVQVEFDGWPSVQKHGPLMSRLLLEVRTAGKKVLWGPERGWSDSDEDDDDVTVADNNTADDQLQEAQNGVQMLKI